MRALIFPLTVASFAVCFAPSARAQDDGTPFGGYYSPPGAIVPAPRASAPEEPPVPEPPAPRFGEAGEVVITGSTGAGVSSTTWDNSDASWWSISASPGFHYFIITNLSVGVDLEVSYGETTGYGADSSLTKTKSTAVSGGPRIGWNVPLGDHVSFWPRVTLAVHHVHSDTQVLQGPGAAVANATGAPSTTRSGPWINAYAPLLLHPKPHLFVGFGPTLYHDFARVRGGPDVGGERTDLGADLEVGGWWGGPKVDATDGGGATPATRRPRFGRAGQIVLTSELGLGGSYTTYAGTNASGGSIGVTAAADFFAQDHLSIGIAVPVSHGESTSFTASGDEVQTSSTSIGVAPRIGVEVPLGDVVSFYPRAAFAFGGGSWEQRSPTSRNQHDERYVSVSLGAPVLVHAATHFFVGFGPYVVHDLTRSDQYDFDNRGTTVGASAVVGGWL